MVMPFTSQSKLRSGIWLCIVSDLCYTDRMISYNAMHYFIWGLILTGMGWAIGSYLREWLLKRRAASFPTRYQAQMSLYMMTDPEQHARVIRQKRLMMLFFICLLAVLAIGALAL